LKGGENMNGIVLNELISTEVQENMTTFQKIIFLEITLFP